MEQAGVEREEKTKINYHFPLFVFEVFNIIFFLFVLFYLFGWFGCFKTYSRVM